MATRDDVGTPKALCLKKHFSMIYPECQIDARVQLYDPSSEAEILSGQPDFVLDCIDNIDTKVINNSSIGASMDFTCLATTLQYGCAFFLFQLFLILHATPYAFSLMKEYFGSISPYVNLNIPSLCF